MDIGLGEAHVAALARLEERDFPILKGSLVLRSLWQSLSDHRMVSLHFAQNM
jgi:hypothetical protein